MPFSRFAAQLAQFVCSLLVVLCRQLALTHADTPSYMHISTVDDARQYAAFQSTPALNRTACPQNPGGMPPAGPLQLLVDPDLDQPPSPRLRERKPPHRARRPEVSAEEFVEWERARRVTRRASCMWVRFRAWGRVESMQGSRGGAHAMQLVALGPGRFGVLRHAW